MAVTREEKEARRRRSLGWYGWRVPGCRGVSHTPSLADPKGPNVGHVFATDGGARRAYARAPLPCRQERPPGYPEAASQPRPRPAVTDIAGGLWGVLKKSLDMAVKGFKAVVQWVKDFARWFSSTQLFQSISKFNMWVREHVVRVIERRRRHFAG